MKKSTTAGAASPASTTPAETRRRPFLLEIGSDDLPARFVPPALSHLAEAVERLLRGAGLSHGEVQVYGAPRRLAVLVGNVAERQDDRESELRGPSLTAAFGLDGAPTAAALGFARKAGIDLTACHRVDDARGGYLVARKLVPGRPAAEVLAAELPALILGIPFPKVMRWGDGDVEYARPLQWLVALLGDEVVPLRIGAKLAGRDSRAHRTLGEDRPVAIASADCYADVLRANAVVVDPRARRQMVEAGIAAALAALPGADWRRDEELLDEVVHLSEHPTVLSGSFEERFFALPPEVITTALRAHQRYFAVVDATSGRLLPHFITVRDGGPRALDVVRRGNERVLRARLADALFYWEFDQRLTPDAQRERLRHVTWLEGFGSVHDKTARLVDLVPEVWAAGLGDGRAAPPAAARAAALCKSDLVSEMIKDGKEFTRLEGTIGAQYARRAGESEEVCRALERHYLPRGAADELPGDRVSSALAVADRLDNLAGCWLAGFAPTGAKDPYGLRRQTLGLLRIVLGLRARVSMAKLLGLALDLHASRASAERRRQAASELGGFVRVRLAGHLEDALGQPGDTIRAVLAVHGDDPTDALAWVEALAGFRDRPDFRSLATGYKRCRNILEGDVLPPAALAGCRERWVRGGESADGDPLSALPEPDERALREQIASSVAELMAAEARVDYATVFRRLSDFGPAIDRFFASVRVNVEDAELRRRRHAFLREVHGLFSLYADFAEVAPTED